MSQCPKCGFQNPPDAQFCQKCANVFSSSNTPNNESKIQSMPDKYLSEQQSIGDKDLNSQHEHIEKHKMKSFKIIIFVLLGIIIVGGLAYAGYFGYNKFFNNTPEKVIYKSFGKMKELNTFSFDLVTVVETPSEEKGLDNTSADLISSTLGLDLNSQKINLRLSGSLDITDKENIKSKAELNLDGGTSLGVFNLKTISDNKKIFLNINKIPTVLAAFIDIDKFKDSWIKIDLESEQELPIDISKELETNTEDTKKIKQILEKDLYKIFEVKEDFGVESLESGKAYHYKVSFNINEIEKIVDEINNVVSDKEKINEFKENISKDNWKELKEENFDIWISQKNYYLVKILNDSSYGVGNSDVTSDVTPDTDLNTDQNEKKVDSEIKIKTILLLDNFNQPVELNIPQETIGIEELISSVFEGLMGGALGSLDSAREKSRDARRLSDIKQIQTALELYYNDANRYPETINDKIEYDGIIYMGMVPTDPEPEQFQYIYQSLNNGQNYKLDFSLEVGTGGFKAGTLFANSSGIEQITEKQNDSSNDFILDSDKDGLINDLEEFYGCDPNNPDTDGDGYLDGDEVENGYDPLVPGNARLDDRM